MARQFAIDVDDGIQSGDPWEFVLRAKNGAVIDSEDFACHLKHSRHDEAAIEAVPDLTNREDEEDPHVLFVVDAADTATCPHNLLDGEVQVGNRTWVKFSLPVSGQITEVEST